MISPFPIGSVLEDLKVEMKLADLFSPARCVGITTNDDLVSFHPLQLIGNGHRLLGSSVGTRKDILEALTFVKRGLVDPVVLPGKLENMDELIVTAGKVSEAPYPGYDLFQRDLTCCAFGQVQGKYVIRLD